ncbi:unnamed protein product [Closterium sp. NIES-54]
MSGSGNGVVATYNGAEEAGGAGTFSVKAGLAQMLKGGVIMDVVNVEQARIAEEAGAVAVMALERVPADIRAQGGVARMSDPEMIKEIKKAVTIPVMAKARIGHFVEAQILEAIGVDYIDESEVLTPADDVNHINKHRFAVPFVCGCRNLGEALRRVAEGAAMIRTKGEAGTGDVIEAVRHVRSVQGEIRRLKALDEDELYVFAKEFAGPLTVVIARLYCSFQLARIWQRLSALRIVSLSLFLILCLSRSSFAPHPSPLPASPPVPSPLSPPPSALPLSAPSAMCNPPRY